MSSILDNTEEINQLSRIYKASIQKISVTDHRYQKIIDDFQKEEGNYFLGML